MRAVFLAVVLAATAGVALAQGPIDRLMGADANRDGAISKAEARAAREATFRRIDANGDGFVTEDERGEKKAKQRGGGGGDANGDGKVSRAEFMDAPYRGFDMFDTNRNDVLDTSELQAAKDRFQQRKNGTP